MIFRSMDEFRAAGFKPHVIIIGAGPAGITVALRLAKSKIPCVILDAGGEEMTEDSQDFYKGKVIGDPYFELEMARLRCLGGTSGHWAGWCRPLDAHDFAVRDWVPNSGWPVDHEAVAAHMDVTREILGLAQFEPDAPLSDAINWVDLIRSEPVVRFGDKYRAELEASPLIAVVLNTYATDLKAVGARVTDINLMSTGKPSGSISAEKVVVATGGIENSRLLLWSNQVSTDPVVPEAKALGRYWMEHPEFIGGDALIFEPDAFKHAQDGWAFFAPSLKAMQDAGVMNFHVVVMPRTYSWTKQLVSDLACVAPSASEWLAAKAGSSFSCYGNQLGVAWEQAPLYDNHISLSATETDKAGVPRVELHWRKGDLERKTLLEGMKMFGTMFAEKNIGRVRLANWLRDGEEYPINDMMAGYHHMGGTRMSNDPKLGVVDADCRVHGMENLFVAGSSIFTTSGYANPTTTLVAFADRLGEHLALSHA